VHNISAKKDEIKVYIYIYIYIYIFIYSHISMHRLCFSVSIGCSAISIVIFFPILWNSQLIVLHNDI
jgi:hypothetical protein